MKKIAVFLLMAFIFALGVFAEDVEYEIRLSHDTENNGIVAGVYITKGNSVAGHFGISYNTGKLVPATIGFGDIPAEIPETNVASESYICSVVKGAADYIIISPDQTAVRELVNREKGYVLFGWYAKKSVDCVKAGECVAELRFKIKDGVSLSDIVRGDIVPVSKASTSSLNVWSGGIMVADMNEVTYFYEPASGNKALGIKVTAPFFAPEENTGNAEETDSTNDENTSEDDGETEAADTKPETEASDSEANQNENEGLTESVIPEEKNENTIKTTDLGMIVKTYSDRIRVFWNKPSDFNVTEYRIYITDKDNYPVRTISGITDVTKSFTVKNLAHDYDFKVKLAAVKPDGTVVYHKSVAVLKTERSTTAPAKIYNVKYKAGDGSLYGMADEQVVFGNHPTKAPTVYAPEGYEFAGWSVDGKDVADLGELKIYSDTVLTAVYTRV